MKQGVPEGPPCFLYICSAVIIKWFAIGELMNEFEGRHNKQTRAWC